MRKIVWLALLSALTVAGGIAHGTPVKMKSGSPASAPSHVSTSQSSTPHASISQSSASQSSQSQSSTSASAKAATAATSQIKGTLTYRDAQGQVITWQRGAVFPPVTVTATNQKTQATVAHGSDSFGGFTIDNVPEGAYWIAAKGPSFNTTQRTQVQVGASPAQVNLDLVQGPSTVSGTVNCKSVANGRQCGTIAQTGTVVKLQSFTNNALSYQATTDAKGGFTIQNVVPGHYEASVMAGDSYTSGSQTFDAPTTKSVEVVVQPTAGADAKTYAVQGQVSCVVTSNARCPARPVSGATVTLLDSNGAATRDATYTATTDANGDYTIRSVPGGSYKISVAKTAGTAAVTSAAKTVPAGDFAVEVSSIVSLRGTVTCQAPANSATACASAAVSGAVVTLLRPTGQATAFTATTAGDGSFTITNAASGAYTISVAATATTAQAQMTNVLLPSDHTVVTVAPAGKAQ